jgi:uncharacterized MnhB-related membrane protein
LRLFPSATAPFFLLSTSGAEDDVTSSVSISSDLLDLCAFLLVPVLGDGGLDVAVADVLVFVFGPDCFSRFLSRPFFAFANLLTCFLPLSSIAAVFLKQLFSSLLFSSLLSSSSLLFFSRFLLLLFHSAVESRNRVTESY